MSTFETKKRLLLSKWRTQIETLTAELEEAKEQIQSLEDDRDEYAEQMEQTLSDVRYWLHDGLVHHKLVSDPRALLRKVEDAIL